MSQDRLKRHYGSLAVVTGASDGIGRAFAEKLAEAGFDLFLIARRQVELKLIADSLHRRHGINVEILPLDLSAPTSASRLLDVLRKREVGIFVAAAGFGTSGQFIHNSVDAELQMIDVNCRAVVELTHGIGIGMAGRGRGGIVLFGSLVGWQGTPAAATYAATKAFIQTFAEGIGDELRAFGVDVLSCAPGPVDSGFALRANMRMGATDSPPQIATESLAALGRRRTVVPGRVGKMLTRSLSLLPRQSRVGIMGKVMRGMVRSSGQGVENKNGKSA
ncbi:SDR family NAD(P)-dependent oxidoreductase [Afipia broomeae]|uniref:SDR family NAD(P)-dependent oxidoreductase n=1 Tax=Afipia broomeae ATCC 49717 TaxID=883078 RepID=K8P5N8_9BRAD|nr:SDR family NAD(P)-dependent oxidoreductase [Afipia broomeae]EKS36761.1 hypothetical protein HMPREF9695_03179 [Afipia broomeae ATCC 49717]